MYNLVIHSKTEGDRTIHTLSREMAETIMDWAYEHADATVDSTREHTLAGLVRDWMEESIEDKGEFGPVPILNQWQDELAWFTHHGEGRCTIRSVHGWTVGFRVEDVEEDGFCLAIRNGPMTVLVDVSEWEVDLI